MLMSPESGLPPDVPQLMCHNSFNKHGMLLKCKLFLTM